MRRASVLVLTAAVTLVAVALVPAPAADSAPHARTLRRAARAAEEPQYSVEFTLHVEGFDVSVMSEITEQKLVLRLYRGGEVAYYEVKPQITAETVKARFGRLGELDLRFRRATTPRSTECKGARGEGEGTFEGTIAFTGENGYVHIDADRAQGRLETFPAGACERPQARPAIEEPLPRRAATGQGEGQATLEAVAGSPSAARFLLAFGTKRAKGTETVITAAREEQREGMLIARGAQVVAGAGAFHWNLAAGTAELHPPAPFSGRAVFHRRPSGGARWTGSLWAPVLGAQPVRLTGGRFRAKLFYGKPD
jgi:hypothetical protein